MTDTIKDNYGLSSNSTEVLRNMALTDAISAQRSVAALREAALASVIKRLDGMNADKMLEVLNAINSTASIEAYAQLIDKIDHRK